MMNITAKISDIKKLYTLLFKSFWKKSHMLKAARLQCWK